MKQKKVLIVSVLAVLLIVLIIILTYCGGNQNKGAGKETEDDTVTSTHTHTWGEWMVSKAATCTDDGQKKCTCILCGETKTEPIPVTAHTEVIDAAVEATCTTTGKTEGKHCSVCGTVTVEQMTTPFMHAPGDWIVDADAEIEKTGKMHKVCTLCGKTVEESTIPPASVGLKYELSSDGTYYIVSGIGECEDRVVIVPSKYLGLPVKGIKNRAFASEGYFRFIVLPDSITELGKHAFQDLDTSVFIKYEDGFYIGTYGNPYFALIGVNDTWITSCTIHPSTKVIADYAFYHCDKLTSITIPDGVVSIGKYAFSDCWGLKSVTLGNGISRIGSYAFDDCHNLTDIRLPDNITSIKSGTFCDCSSLTSIAIPKGVTSIGNGAFKSCSGLTSITIPNGVTSIGDGAFSGCSRLKSITIPDSITAIGNNAFYECSGLTGITIGNGVKSIGDGAFEGCTALTSITIPDSVTSIGDRAFDRCSSLTSITIPEGVTKIGKSAVYACEALTSIIFKNPNGWHNNNPYKDDNGETVDVSDPVKAAEYLKAMAGTWERR